MGTMAEVIWGGGGGLLKKGGISMSDYYLKCRGFDSRHFDNFKTGLYLERGEIKSCDENLVASLLKNSGSD